ncbi:hypothetical protein DPMN_183498 [Dreissena polymorpha]|uniref:Uncharacterized protein n=1 Tax=Dreissena polymorpha TaxID=45954 RepID=A0A9D4DGQ8_DREPO|nr:hypothetical protein DPMN_183498 [Dreissena polymorpha]
MVPVRSMSDCDNGTSTYHVRLLQRYQYTDCQTETMVQVYSMSDCDQYQYIACQTETMVPVCILYKCDNGSIV